MGGLGRDSWALLDVYPLGAASRVAAVTELEAAVAGLDLHLHGASPCARLGSQGTVGSEWFRCHGAMAP